MAKNLLDRGLINDNWLDTMPQTTITHLSSTGSDHCPLLPEMKSVETDYIKYFKFLNYWVRTPHFIDTLKACRQREANGDNMWKFHHKMKRVSKTLSDWSRN